MDTTDFAAWILQFVQGQGVAVTLITFGLWFLDRRIWPLVTDQIIPTWQATYQAKTKLQERQTIAVERIADTLAEPLSKTSTKVKQ